MPEPSQAYLKSNTSEKSHKANASRWNKHRQMTSLLESTEADLRSKIKDIESLDSATIKQRVERGMLETAAITGMKYVRDLCAGVKKSHQDAMTWGLFYDKVTRTDEPMRAQNFIVNLFGSGEISAKLMKSTEGIDTKSITCVPHSPVPETCTILKTEPLNTEGNSTQHVDK